MNNNFENWLKKARSRSPFEQAICETKFLHFAAEGSNLDNAHYPYMLKVTHSDSFHDSVIRYLKYETLRELKASAEYLSKYPNVICEVM